LQTIWFETNQKTKTLKIIIIRLLYKNKTGEPLAMKKTTILAFLFTMLALPALAQPPMVTPDCDRNCLNSYVDRYIEAMVAKEVSDDLFAREAKFTENGTRFPLGIEGGWDLTIGRGDYSFYVPDTELPSAHSDSRKKSDQ
jgi:hypothetical protein